VTAIEVRPAGPADLPGIAAVALGCGQDGEWAGADPAYVGHLLAHGTVVVGVRGGSVVGFGATRTLAMGGGTVSMLCDLFVDPAAHGGGCGRALLAAGWRVAEFDVFMASDPGLLDPRRAVPSPALA
jgi:hypothetical protein